MEICQDLTSSGKNSSCFLLDSMHSSLTLSLQTSSKIDSQKLEIPLNLKKKKKQSQKHIACDCLEFLMFSGIFCEIFTSETPREVWLPASHTRAASEHGTARGRDGLSTVGPDTVLLLQTGAPLALP